MAKPQVSGATETPRGRGRPSRKSAEDIDELILAVARRRFAQNGFKRTSMEEVLSEAQIARATLYLRYSDKLQLFQAVLFQVAMEAMPPEPDEFASVEDCIAFEIERFLTVSAHPEIMMLLDGLNGKEKDEGSANAIEKTLRAVGLEKLSDTFDVTAAAEGIELSDSILLAQLVFDIWVARRRRELALGTVDLAERNQFARSVAALLVCGAGGPLRPLTKSNPE